jgi:N-acetylmuramoyl-L-alanine amidase
MQKKIYIDPGHGDIGGDFGAIGADGTREGDIALAIAEILKGYLIADGYQVFMSREKETSDFPIYSESLGDLPSRVQGANNADCDLFISIHCNAGDGGADGTEIYHCPGSTEGEKLAKAILNEVLYLQGIKKNKYKASNNLFNLWNFPNRGVKEANFYVLTNTSMTAVLCETLFISNSDDLKLLKDREFQLFYASAIESGINEYFNIKPEVTPVTPPPVTPVTSSKYSDLIQKYSKQYSLDAKFVDAIIQQESGYKPEAVSIHNAKGLMQLLPDTFKECLKDLKLPENSDPFNPEININCGCYHFAYLKSLFNITKEDNSRATKLLIACAYNEGQNTDGMIYAREVIGRVK